MFPNAKPGGFHSTSMLRSNNVWFCAARPFSLFLPPMLSPRRHDAIEENLCRNLWQDLSGGSCWLVEWVGNAGECRVYIYIYNPKNPFWFGTLVGQVPQGETGEGPKIVFYVFLVFSRILKVCQGMLRCFHEDKGPRGLNHICFECHSGS